MTAARLMEMLGTATPFVLLGVVLGAGYFAALRSSVERYLFSRSIGVALALHCGRLLFAGVAFVLIAQAGAAALLSALGGFLLARTMALRPRNLRP
jgi:F1F0 ATPase subunit 2